MDAIHLAHIIANQLEDMECYQGNTTWPLVLALPHRVLRNFLEIKKEINMDHS